ncbi:hypothetical protein BpHYR1_039854 [Brachionus plicatilis]|uniref:Uncharacterized protein n=1 Tax=Brachionus plicatilis TaxID=10195 RepID=A0A3M7PV09_BRAPC|nr:hypothetical protein BpHYR1_039854 [Brachionus plicatilis]
MTFKFNQNSKLIYLLFTRWAQDSQVLLDLTEIFCHSKSPFERSNSSIYQTSLNLNAGEKAMTENTTSQETSNVVKTALTKHANPVPCDLCGELMKNIKGCVCIN